MTAPGSRPAATWTTTSPGPADPPASRICVHAAGATTSSRPEASYDTRLHPDGSVTTTTLLGTTITTRPEPLPGYGPGEAYATLHSA